MNGKRNGTRSHKLTDHHLIPASRGGTGPNRRILAIHAEQHEAWHTLFGNATLDEIVAELASIQEFFEDPDNRRKRVRWQMRPNYLPSCDQTETGTEEGESCNGDPIVDLPANDPEERGPLQDLRNDPSARRMDLSEPRVLRGNGRANGHGDRLALSEMRSAGTD